MTPFKREILLVATLIGVGMFLFPPMGHLVTYGNVEMIHYGWFLDDSYVVVDYKRLMIQYALLGLVALWLALGEKPTSS